MSRGKADIGDVNDDVEFMEIDDEDDFDYKERDYMTIQELQIRRFLNEQKRQIENIKQQRIGLGKVICEVKRDLRMSRRDERRQDLELLNHKMAQLERLFGSRDEPHFRSRGEQQFKSRDEQQFRSRDERQFRGKDERRFGRMDEPETTG
ncbi:hypothetical protein SNE40_013914 [Patella caerulea]|uniref:Uncharacterized protein n=1 Tax=Patella caerulea TaxID=87958 RepID=A0AAN8PBT5_PATCE